VTNRLNGKVALITGASAGIGAACVRALAAEGAHIVLTARRQERLAALVREIEQQGGTGQMIVGDAREEDTARRAIAAAVKSYGRLDILVNNAGGQLQAVERDERGRVR
jgi:NADP-dependent 3-hydroxy acid dehydrogenase YdfG